MAILTRTVFGTERLTLCPAVGDRWRTVVNDDTPIIQADIAAIAGKLEALSPVQKAMMSAVVAVAAKVIDDALASGDEFVVRVAHPLPAFSEQFATAFTSGRRRVSLRSTLDGGQAVVFFKISRASPGTGA